MQTPADYRAKGTECAALSVGARDPQEAKRLVEPGHSFVTLADNAQWMIDHPESDLPVPGSNSTEEDNNASEGGRQLTQ
jgi:hypothetical protein